MGLLNQGVARNAHPFSFELHHICAHFFLFRDSGPFQKILEKLVDKNRERVSNYLYLSGLEFECGSVCTLNPARGEIQGHRDLVSCDAEPSS